MNLRLSLLNDQVRKANMGLKIEAIFFFVQSSFGTGQGYRVMIHDLPRFFFFLFNSYDLPRAAGTGL